MTMIQISDKQESFILGSDAFINVADGAVRSGKSFSDMYRFAEWMVTAPTGDMMLMGKTERTARRNVIYPMQEIFGNRIRYVQGMGEMHFAGRRVYVVGANNEGAESKVRGATLVGALCNEITLYPENIFNTLIDRCSVDGAQIFADCNPDSPYHWLHTKYLTNEALLGNEVKRWQFRLDDNPSLTEEYKEREKKLHTGLWYRRMILGEWTVAEGAIYDQFDQDIHVVRELPQISRTWLAIDHGTRNAFVALLIGLGVDDRLYVIGEWRWDSRERGRQLANVEYSDRLAKWLHAEYKHLPWPHRIYYDPSAADFAVQMWRDKWHAVKPADNDVPGGIRNVSSLLTINRLRIHERCEGLRGELSSYHWDEKAQLRGEDKPVKQADHGPDALRYGVTSLQSIWRRWIANADRIAA